MNMRLPYLYVAVTLTLVTAVPMIGIAGDRTSQDPFKAGGNQSFDSFQKESEASMKMEGDRGAPGINSGGQDIKPGEGEQDGRPGTIGGRLRYLPRKKHCNTKARIGPQDSAFHRERSLNALLRLSPLRNGRAVGMAPPGPCSSPRRSMLTVATVCEPGIFHHRRQTSHFLSME